MPGGFDPFPRRPGGRRGRNVETLTKSLLAQRGTAYSTDPSSFVWLESTCTARAIATGWETNQKLANQFDPYRASDFLPRWERIYGITPPAGATESDRRTAVAARWIMIGKRSDPGGLQALLQTLLPNTFVQVHYLSNHWAVNKTPGAVFYPDAGTPLGTHPSTGAAGDWSSTGHHIAIELQQPSWMSDEAYHREARSVYSGVLDSFVPAWVTFSSFKRAADGTISFFLDSSGNLDNNALGIISYGYVVVNGGAVTQKVFPYLFTTGATGASSNGRVYANFYGFALTAGVHYTFTLAVGTAADTWGRIIALGADLDPYTGGSSASFHNTAGFTSGAGGNYALEVSANADSTLGTSPGTISITVASP